MLTEVTSVEVAEWDSCGELRKFMPMNLSLFPKAVSVKFSGDLTDTVIHSFLPANRISKLRHLHLEDVQSDARGCTSTEATIQFLNGLVGKCTALKSLTVIDSEFNLDDPTAKRPTEWTAFAQFLSSVKGNLEVFYFKSHGDGDGDLDSADRVYDPELYRESIQKILDDGNWPHLRKVTILPPKKQPKKQKKGRKSK